MPDDLARCLQVFLDYFTDNKEQFDLVEISKTNFFHVEFDSILNALSNFNSFRIFSINFFKDSEKNEEIRKLLDFNANSDFLINMLCAAFHKFFIENSEKFNISSSSSKFWVQISKHSKNLTQIKKLKSNMCSNQYNVKYNFTIHFFYFKDRFVTVKGHVIRVTNVRPYCFQMAFECAHCKFIQTKILFNNKFSMPNRVILLLFNHLFYSIIYQ